MRPRKESSRNGLVKDQGLGQRDWNAGATQEASRRQLKYPVEPDWEVSPL